MIKVNLLRSVDTTKTRVAEETVSRTIQFKSSDRPEIVKLGVRLGLMVLPPLAVYMVSANIVSQKTDELTKIQNDLNKVSAEVTVATNTFKTLEGYKTDNENLNLLVGSIAGLSKRRKLAIENLDNLQKLTPPRVWFQEIRFTDASINIVGLAVNNDDFSDFLKALSETAFFSRVDTVRNEEIKKKYGRIRSFEVNCPLSGKI